MNLHMQVLGKITILPKGMQLDDNVGLRGEKKPSTINSVFVIVHKTSY